MNCVKITINGLVQGVGFRYATLQKARQLGIKGFVRNNYDGSVYIEACGKETNLNAFIKWCYTGPPHASVHDVTISESPVKETSTFEIR